MHWRLGKGGLLAEFEAAGKAGRQRYLDRDPIMPEQLTDALDAAVTRVEFNLPTLLVKIRNIPTAVSVVNYPLMAWLLESGSRAGAAHWRRAPNIVDSLVVALSEAEGRFDH